MAHQCYDLKNDYNFMIYCVRFHQGDDLRRESVHTGVRRGNDRVLDKMYN